MKIFHIPCLEDNYSYLLIDEATNEAAVVDPVEPEKVLEVANKHSADVKFVLTTHKHWDHAGGNEKIKELVPGIKVYGGSVDEVKGCTNKVANGDKILLGAETNILCLHTPCHTLGHISYYVTGKEEESPAVFTGDTLFVAGCGRFFEGTAEQMYQSLCVTLGSLPKPTRVYCGHEYTVKNLQFALTVEPENTKIVDKLAWAQNQQKADLPTIPSTIEEELETNPFMRVDISELQILDGCELKDETMPFHNLNHLELCCNSDKMMLEFLKRSPVLETLSLPWVGVRFHSLLGQNLSAANPPAFWNNSSLLSFSSSQANYGRC